MTKRIVLAGGGHAHLSVLADWLERPCDQAERVLIMPSERSAYSGMLPGWMAGIYQEDEIFIPVAKLARKAGVRVILASVDGLDAEAQRLQLSTGEGLDFDLLSLATGGEVPGHGLQNTGSKLLTVRPVEQFVQDWRALVEQASMRDAPSVAIVGGGAGGIELALAARARLRDISEQSRVCLVAPQDGFLKGHADNVRALALDALRQRGITVHWSMAKGHAEGLELDDGQLIGADAVIAATGSQPQAWLARSGLACTDNGFVLVGGTLQSVSHPNIFAAGDIIQRSDRQLERSGVHAVKAGPVLANNLRNLSGENGLQSYDPKRVTLYLLSTGDGRAILSWGKYAMSGRSPWWLKERIDRGFVNRFTRLAQ